MDRPPGAHDGSPRVRPRRYAHPRVPIEWGRFFEWEDFGMVEALQPQLENGQNHLICVDSIDRVVIDDEARHTWHWADRFLQHVLTEALPEPELT